MKEKKIFKVKGLKDLGNVMGMLVEFDIGLTTLLDEIARERKISRIEVILKALADCYYVHKEVFKKQDRKLCIVSRKDEKIIQDLELD